MIRLLTSRLPAFRVRALTMRLAESQSMKAVVDIVFFMFRWAAGL
jgi:hypothetical protein